MDLLQTCQYKGLVLDGAMSDELEAQGVDTNNKLWTATALTNNLPAVYQTHRNYLQAGAQLIITNTYQANVQAFEKAGYTNQQAKNFIVDAVKVALKARDDYETITGKHTFVAGTVGAYGAYLADGSEYRGDYNLADAEYLAFHLPRLKTIIEQKPDCIAIETQPNLKEVKCLLTWMENNYPKYPVYVSFTLRDAQTISDGTSLAAAITVVNQFSQVFAVGINCTNPNLVTAAVKVIRPLTSKEIVVYPNQGASYDPTTKTWQDLPEKIDFYQATKKWYAAGAHLIGSCCTTNHEQTAEIARAFDEIN
ncbi:homocysteine S-methyltransferase [Lactobacillus sp. ESL0684]|uniref:homocysteine S-methyltransferase n=1 Tax=Lactobacillus sp. ESL0684 TaxID=2983213 RepID=UPI0023F7FD45|nr:homocysteine S-methyltransferase [Lactobacillus sp. ESL0684]WEV43934.1 homocysteine S-methyltransferase [Lactobacillus sp. ESL0684]